jgi:hypothetical protein
MGRAQLSADPDTVWLLALIEAMDEVFHPPSLRTFRHKSVLQPVGFASGTLTPDVFCSAYPVIPPLLIAFGVMRSGRPFRRTRSCLEYALRVMGERSDLSGVLPKLDMMAANQLLRPLNGHFVIRAFERN